MNGIAFRIEVLPIQRVNYVFVYLLWSEIKMSTVDGPSTLIQFIDWVGCRCEGVFLYMVRFFGAVL